MERDEQNAMSAESVAKTIFRLAERKRAEPLYAFGAQYKLFAVMKKLLPEAAVNRIVGAIYT